MVALSSASHEPGPGSSLLTNGPHTHSSNSVFVSGRSILSSHVGSGFGFGFGFDPYEDSI